MSNERERDTEAERALKELFSHATPRLQPPTADAEEIRRAVYAEWDAVTRRRIWRQRAGFAAAASVLLAVAIWVGGDLNPASPTPVVASVERTLGTAEGSAGVRVAVGEMLPAGARLSTGAGQVALRLTSGGSLRVGPRSEVVLTGADAAELVAGMLYFDSEDRRSGVAFAVTTEIGTVRDVGTQFLVRFDDDKSQLDVGVRDGRIALMTGRESGTAGVGERLVATQQAATIRRETMATYGGEWDWAEKLAPPFDIDGRTISELLDWVAAQTGRTVVFVDPAAERLAREHILRGSIDLEPLQKLSAALATTDLEVTLEDGRVLVGMR